jgi:hypothetical protein
MPTHAAAANRRRGRRTAPRRRKLRWLPSARTRRRALRTLRRQSPWVQIAIGFAVTVAIWLAVNGVVQVFRKPTELFFPVSGTLYKRPSETWLAYQSIFRQHSTDTISAEFLAALAQVEGSGNPIARTYWRWRWSLDPLEVYRPASSAVGMYQITDGTFEQARRYCVHRHAVVMDGPWYAWRSCWFNWLYFRVVPSHAVELTSAYLDRAVAGVLERHGIQSATAEQKENLAALIHLCGAGVGERYARRGLHLAPGLRCGDHDAKLYVTRVNLMKRAFAALSARGS